MLKIKLGIKLYTIVIPIKSVENVFNKTALIFIEYSKTKPFL